MIRDFQKHWVLIRFANPLLRIRRERHRYSNTAIYGVCSLHFHQGSQTLAALLFAAMREKGTMTEKQNKAYKHSHLNQVYLLHMICYHAEKAQNLLSSHPR